MSIALASAWHPRGEMGRFRKIFPKIEAAYAAIMISLPPGTDPAEFSQLETLANVSLAVTEDWSWGRQVALRHAFLASPDFIHYADFDRLVRWVETYPEEWRRGLEQIQEADYTIFERSEKAWDSHPQALRQTEKISSGVIAHLVGRFQDFSSGSKGLSRRATRFLLANSREERGSSGRALGTDAEWTVLLHRGGFCLQSVQVDGLDWESADRFQAQAASPEAQRRAAEIYDADPENWAQRVRVAQEIVESALEAFQRPLIYPE